MPGAAALSSRYYAFVRFAPAFRSANPPSLHARAPLPAHNPQGRICCASIPIGRFPSGVAGVFSTFGKFFLCIMFSRTILSDDFRAARLFSLSADAACWENAPLYIPQEQNPSRREFCPNYPTGVVSLLIGFVFTDYVLKIRSPLRSARSQILLPYSAKTKPFVNILSELSPLV